MSTRDELLDAWERQFPSSRNYPLDQTDPGRGDDEADALLEEAALRIGHPTTPRTFGLTRGGEAEQRIEAARKELRVIEVNGGDVGTAMRDLHEATDALIELERLDVTDQTIDLGGASARTVRTPAHSSAWHPVR